MIVGYNGSDFSGSQKNPGVRTVEEEIEKALFDIDCISHHNFGDLKKVGWCRATRTDKSVHALQNVFSCKVHMRKEYRDGEMEVFRTKLNEALEKRLPEKNKHEVKVFCVIEVSNRFNAKNNTSYREYSYYLPSFLLASNKSIYLGKLGTNLMPEEKKQPTEEEITGVKVVNGITITKRLATDIDGVDYQFNHQSRDISHLTSKPELIRRIYGYRLTEEDKAKVDTLFRETFIGTKPYHNYTRDMKPEQNASKRFMMELRANDYMYVNQDTF